MTARRNVTATSTAASWIVLTMVAREEQTHSPPTIVGDGEDDGGVFLEAPTTVEIVTKVKVARSYIRYFYSRRDAQPGSEVHFTNGHVMIVQEPLADVNSLLPGFVEVHVSGAPSEVMVNPATIRFLRGHYPQLGQSQAEPGSKLTFANGHGLEVTESFDELAGRLDIN